MRVGSTYEQADDGIFALFLPVSSSPYRRRFLTVLSAIILAFCYKIVECTLYKQKMTKQC